MTVAELFKDHQGWVLAFMGSVMGIVGASTIYLDVLVRMFNRRSHFSIKNNENFMIYGFSISSGTLMLTALYRLLPESFEYFHGAKSSVGVATNVMCYFIGGTIVCIGFNNLVHKLTSKSIVHCNHDDHDHGHGSGANYTDIGERGHEHSHEHGHNEELEHEHEHEHEHSHGHTNDHTHGHSHMDEEQLIENTEATPLISSKPPLQNRKSLIELAMDKLTQQQQCTGIDDVCDGNNKCLSKELTLKVSSDLHNLNLYRDTKHSLVAYTHTHHDHDSHHSSQAMAISTSISPDHIMLSNEPNLDLHALHKGDHHHKVNTPVSQLLSIGLQTCLAMTLHKLPEGFIMYATSKANPELGVSIFISLALHNIVEGFSMTLPLYLAMDSRIKAFSIATVLCAFSQPLGALLAYLFLKDRELDEVSSNYIFGSLIGVTSGFLIIVSMQMFASAIQFGGSTSQVVKLNVVGMFIILLSGVLSGHH